MTNNYTQWDVVVVDFPFTDQAASKVRPALVVSNDTLSTQTGKYWLLMITSAVGALNHGDIEIADFQNAGLPKASLIRTSKITTLEASGIRRKVGKLPANLREKVRVQISTFLTS
jgi:mRNA interferase MazF